MMLPGAPPWIENTLLVVVGGADHEKTKILEDKGLDGTTMFRIATEQKEHSKRVGTMSMHKKKQQNLGANLGAKSSVRGKIGA